MRANDPKPVELACARTQARLVHRRRPGRDADLGHATSLRRGVRGRCGRSAARGHRRRRAGDAARRDAPSIRPRSRGASVDAAARRRRDRSRSVARRLEPVRRFAMCYADLDHFKEFNDRYSYYDGDRVIRILAKILHDVVKGLCGEDGFVGHIGGDDFIFVVPTQAVGEACARDRQRVRSPHPVSVLGAGPSRRAISSARIGAASFIASHS